MKNKSLLAGILLLVLLLAGAGLAYHFLAPQLNMDSLATEPPKETQTGTGETDGTEAGTGLMLDFRVYDPQGNPAQLSDFVGKPIVLNFWSSRCGPCKSEMPDFQKAYEQLGDEVQFLMVNVTDGYWDTKETAMDFIAQNGYTFPVYLDLDNDAAGAYNIYSLPSSFFFLADGTLAARATGAINAETLQKGIDMIYTAP